MKSAFEKIAAGLEDAIAFAGGETDRGMVAALNVRIMREATKLTQNASVKKYIFLSER